MSLNYAKLERLTRLVDDEIATIESDERYQDEPALVQINAPLALIQVGMSAKMGLLKKLKQELDR